LFRDGEEGAHPEKEGQGQVLEENRFQDNIGIMDHQSFSCWSGSMVLSSQMSRAIRKKALAGRISRPLRTYQPPLTVSGRISMPKSDPEPKSSRMNATEIRIKP